MVNAPLGNLVTLGTPFLDTMSPIRKRSENLTKVLSRLVEAGMISIGLLSFYLSLFEGLNWLATSRDCARAEVGPKSS
ncbi:hypothetical protein ACVIYL_003643 [Bradyrhizobium sp. USDA 3315]